MRRLLFGFGLFIPFLLLSQPLQTVKVMSFNIRLNVQSDSSNAWPNRTALVESQIRFHDADLLGIQEALPDQMEDLIAMLPDYQAHGVARDTGRWGEYSAIFFRKARFTLLEGNTFWLSETPDIPSKGWDAALNRIVTWAKFRDKFSGETFYYFNTHFDHRGKNARLESARLIRAQIARLNPGKLPVILSGDFNFTPEQAPYNALTASGGLRDAGLESMLAVHGPTSTWSGFTFPGVPGRRIDFIFVQHQLKVMRYGTLTDSWSGRYPSDHLPVLAELWINPPVVLTNGHAHNDYEHDRPLHDALEQGFNGVEADVWLRNGELYVSHDKPRSLDESQTLQKLYLEPLAKRAYQYQGRIYPQSTIPFLLMVDIKAEGEAVFHTLMEQLGPYRWLLEGPQPVVQLFLSGDRPIELVLAQEQPLLGLDGRPEDLGKSIPAAYMPVVSQRFGKVANWNGKGEIPTQEAEKLRSLFEKAHAEGKKVRLWASPENENAWRQLTALGQDLINTDQLMEFRQFRLAESLD